MRRLILLMAAMGASVLLVSGVAYALTIQCGGAGDQDPDPGLCVGTPEDDEITGTNQPDVIRALQHFRHVFGRPLLVVWDRSNTRRDRRVQDFIAAHAGDYAAWPLPPYAPDLNPEEQANGVIKSRMANAPPDSIAVNSRLK